MVKENFERDRDARNTGVVEIRAFIGILLLAGILESNGKRTKHIFNNSKGSGVESCYLAMSEKRFLFLMRCMRFDDYRDRQQRREIDRLAPIREFFELSVRYIIIRLFLLQVNHVRLMNSYLHFEGSVHFPCTCRKNLLDMA